MRRGRTYSDFKLTHQVLTPVFHDGTHMTMADLLYPSSRIVGAPQCRRTDV